MQTKTLLGTHTHKVAAQRWRRRRRWRLGVEIHLRTDVLVLDNLTVAIKIQMMKMEWNEKSQNHLKSSLHKRIHTHTYRLRILRLLFHTADDFFFLSSLLCFSWLSPSMSSVSSSSFSWCFSTIFIRRIKFMGWMCELEDSKRNVALALSHTLCRVHVLLFLCVYSVWRASERAHGTRDFQSGTGYIIIVQKKAHTHTFCQIKLQYDGLTMMIVTYRTRYVMRCDVWGWEHHTFLLFIELQMMWVARV